MAAAGDVKARVWVQLELAAPVLHEMPPGLERFGALAGIVSHSTSPGRVDPLAGVLDDLAVEVQNVTRGRAELAGLSKRVELIAHTNARRKRGERIPNAAGASGPPETGQPDWGEIGELNALTTIINKTTPPTPAKVLQW